MTKHYCPKCKEERTFIYYHGCLGYESFACEYCGFDVADIPYLNLKEKELKGGLKNG
jgi:hypothetical protein